VFIVCLYDVYMLFIVCLYVALLLCRACRMEDICKNGVNKQPVPIDSVIYDDLIADHGRFYSPLTLEQVVKIGTNDIVDAGDFYPFDMVHQTLCKLVGVSVGTVEFMQTHLQPIMEAFDGNVFITCL
jgi:hypothetical protein